MLFCTNFHLIICAVLYTYLVYFSLDSSLIKCYNIIRKREGEASREETKTESDPHAEYKSRDSPEWVTLNKSKRAADILVMIDSRTSTFQTRPARIKQEV